MVFLTQYSGSILGPIAKLLGWIMNWIYLLLEHFGIENIGITIIVLTVLIYMCMLPLTIRQQKFSKLQQKMQPEIKAIQEKYKGKKDQESQLAMNQETQALYSKYGVSPMGSCLQLVIQMPIFLALYRVIFNVPAYVPGVKKSFSDLVDGIVATEGYQETMTSFVETMKLSSIRADFTGSDIEVIKNYIVDAVYKMSTAGWDTLREVFPNLTEIINSTEVHLNHMNYFLGMNISNSPFQTIQLSLRSHSYGMIFLALLVPLCSYASQMANIKLMPQASTDPNDPMARQMKTMNVTMPLFSLVLCFTVPVGLGIYWVFSALTRMIQQFFVNKHIENLNLDEIIAKNQEKHKKNLEKMGLSEELIRNTARMNTKRMDRSSSSMSEQEREEKIARAYEYRKTANPKSLTAKADMVREFNERNNK